MAIAVSLSILPFDEKSSYTIYEKYNPHVNYFKHISEITTLLYLSYTKHKNLSRRTVQ